jgi:CubicO group peptidase (beta-lactamase class C family)
MANNLPKDKLMLLLDGRTTSPYLDPATVFDGGSGLVSSTEDYLKFAQMLLNGGKLGDARIISRKSVELFSRNHLGKEITDGDGFPEGMGFGITVGVTTDSGLTGQHGSDGSYYWGGAASTIFWVDPKEDLVAVAMTQLMGSPWPLRTEFRTLVYQAIDD